MALALVGVAAVSGPPVTPAILFVTFGLLVGPKALDGIDLASMKNWLALHNDAVMAVLFLVFGVNLIAKGLPPT